MPLEFQCACALCSIEAHLLAEFRRTHSDCVRCLLTPFPHLSQYSSVSSLLSHIRESTADESSDVLLREIFELQKNNEGFTESLLILIFLPMLHRTIRRISRQQAGLSEDDITQQALSVLLQSLRSREVQARKSYFAFAISRDVKRQLFAWANRESMKASILNQLDGDVASSCTTGDALEQNALLRHFLHRCVTKKFLTDSEVDLLIQFKLDGHSGEELATLNGSSSNAVRQRFKRLLAKLRRLAR
jgi:DNA-directed RNA polymerase specialized sigma24 family protein